MRQHFFQHVARSLFLFGVIPALAASPAMEQYGRTTPPKAPRPSPPNLYDNQTEVAPSHEPSIKGGHNAETYPGRQPHGSGSGAAIAAGVVGGIAATVIIAKLIEHHEASPEHLSSNGPGVPKAFDMSGVTIKCLIGPDWPVVVDFMLYAPGTVLVEIAGTDKHHFVARMTNTPNERAYGIFHMPKDFGDKVQVAVLQVHAVPLGGRQPVSLADAPPLRVFGIGGGVNAVGSVAIDQLSFQPAAIHPKAKEVATYGFHAHSAFNGVKAEFIFVTLQNGHVLVQQDQEETLSAVPQGERAHGTWQGDKGKAGEHMLQVRAWRGIENGGDWVVAWSPDIVDVVK
jgi:hypothetical protein